ncbi:PadR family transcriptional regulator [Peptococcus simiae]|uniref:PadR family transcriptional regulator n=1 Tax=Peptococcus simiae TaxID=1643805 RepID=A0ABW9H081_9FIRM
MNSQFKKGVLELVVLAVIAEKDRYGYEIINLVEDVMDVNEGTIYPLLKRLTNEHYFETYLKESTEGPPRKYYRLTAAGALQLGRLKEEWFLFTERIERFLKEVEGRDQGNLPSKAE